MSYKSRRKSCLFNRKRYWYHVSTTLKKKEETLTPWGNRKGFNRGDHEPDGDRICVAPSIEQCITAIPYTLSASITIYRTKDKVMATLPKDIFDMHITGEGWLQTQTTFVKIGSLDFDYVEEKLNVENVKPQAASLGNTRYSGRVLKWWKKARIKRFIKCP